MNGSILKVVICLVVLQLTTLEGYLLPTLPSGFGKQSSTKVIAKTLSAATYAPPSKSTRNPFASSMMLQAAAKGGKKSSEDKGKYTDVSALPTGGAAKTITVDDVKKMMEAESSEDEDDDFLPDKEMFAKYFKKHATGTGRNKVITKDQFMQYEDVVELLKEELVAAEDVGTLWNSVVGDSEGGLKKDEAYELLCMITDLPNTDEQGYFDEEFLRLAGKDPDTVLAEGGEVGAQRDFSGVYVNYREFMNWEEVKELIKENMLTQVELDDIWADIVGGNKQSSQMDREMFDSVNLAIDAALGDRYGEGGDGEEDDEEGDEDADEEEA